MELNRNYFKTQLQLFGSDIKLFIYEYLGEEAILQVWPSAKFLSSYLYQIRKTIKNKKILELGSGTGICGIVSNYSYIYII